MLLACRGGSSVSEPAPAPFLPPSEADAPGAELATDPLPWNPAFLAHHEIAGVTVLSELAGSDRGLEDSLRFDESGHLVERHLKSGPDPIGTWGLEWKEGRLVQLTETLPGGAVSRTTYQYDQAGRPVEIAHPDQVEKLVEQRVYDAGGKLATRRWTRDGAPSGEETIERDAQGRMRAAVRQSPQGERLEERRTYQADRLVGVAWTQPGASKTWRISYDKAGRIQRIDIDQGGAAEVFEYDERGFPRARRKTSPPAPPAVVEYRFDQPRATP
jgi:YD repeat-containing protein